MTDETRESGGLVDDASHDPAFQLLLEKLHAEHQFDFRQYKRASLERRIRVRMQQVRSDSFPAYLAFLDGNPDEHTALINTILINVTGFLRDPEPWELLRTEVIPRLVQEASVSRILRIWSAGCSSGEEAYSLAMLVAEQLGDRASNFNVKIYGTDVDDEALAIARHGLYRLEELKDLPGPLLDRYFAREGQAYRFRRDFRRWCIFGHHNIAQDPPLAHVDLLVCRNVLIYFNVDLQERILARFHYAVREGGFLFLGRAESLLARSRWFTPYQVKWRIFQRTEWPAPTVTAFVPRAPQQAPGFEAAPRIAASNGSHLERVFSALPSAVMLIDLADTIRLWNAAAEMLFGIPAEHAVGRKFRDLDISYRVEGLRAHVEEVKTSHIPARMDPVTFSRRSGEVVHAEISIIPITEDATITGVAVHASDATEAIRLKDQMSRLAEQHSTAIEELQSTNEELETTNEELQSTNEELETTNEELQSTNEELETTVEELQAAGTEVSGLTAQLDFRTKELRVLDDYQQSVMSSLRHPILVLDRDGLITTWNAAAEHLWGLRSQHVLNRPFWTLPVGDAAQKIRETLARVTKTGESEVVPKIPFRLASSEMRQLTIQVTPLLGPTGELIGVVGAVVRDDSGS